MKKHISLIELYNITYCMKSYELHFIFTLSKIKNLENILVSNALLLSSVGN